MAKYLALLFGGIVAGVGATNWLGKGDGSAPGGGKGEPEMPASLSADHVTLEDRLLSLEASLAIETDRVTELETVLGELLAEDPQTVSTEAAESRFDQAPAERARTRLNRGERSDPGSARRRQLEAAGIAPDVITRILERDDAMRLSALRADWERRRQNYLEGGSSTLGVSNVVREELGDEQYEQYLEATGRPSSVRVSDLFENSPAALAGMQAGDQIVRYNGERVYGISDLNLANVRGAPGDLVTIDVMRDGALVQLSIENGPLGITAGRSGRGR